MPDGKNTGMSTTRKTRGRSNLFSGSEVIFFKDSGLIFRLRPKLRGILSESEEYSP